MLLPFPEVAHAKDGGNLLIFGQFVMALYSLTFPLPPVQPSVLQSILMDNHLV